MERALVGMSDERSWAEQEDVMVLRLGVPEMMMGDLKFLFMTGGSEQRKFLVQPESMMAMSQGGTLLVVKGCCAMLILFKMLRLLLRNKPECEPSFHFLLSWYPPLVSNRLTCVMWPVFLWGHRLLL